MSKEDLVEFEGDVIEVLPNNTYRVKIETGMELVCYANGKLRQNKIRIILGDRVKVEISVYDLTKGRITFRL